ncbi:MAG: aminopeptidase P family N-terminal domain-containing protein [Acidobacteria bacterium]|nr:aminopeptidase P family N-terminal domain-containing protein [Acidobacteriota bacterium]
MSFDHAARIDRLFESMPTNGVDTVLLSVGADMPWLIGYETTSFERLTMAVLRIGEVPKLVVPKLEAPRVDDLGGAFEVVPWDETDDPIARVADFVGSGASLAVGDATWSRFTLALQERLQGRLWTSAGPLMEELRRVKESDELDRLRVVGAVPTGSPLPWQTTALAARPKGRWLGRSLAC